MRKTISIIGLAAAAGTLFAGLAPASAADLRRSYGPPAVTGYSSGPTWTGLYLGGWGGYAKTTTSITPDFGQQPIEMNGVVGGGMVGVNYQINSLLVAGIEVDFGTGNLKHSETALLCPAVFCGADIRSTTEMRLLFMSTARLRLGVLVTPSTLAYVAGGGAWGLVEAKNTTDMGFIGVDTFTQKNWVGGWTIGGGLEQAFGGWRGRLEYVYASLNVADTTSSFVSPIFGTSTVRSRVDTGVHLVRVGLAYQF